MTIKQAIYRELRFALCRDGVLSGKVAEDHVKLDMRGMASGPNIESDYPWLIFGRDGTEEDNQVRYARDRFTVALIGLQGSATKGDALLEEIRGLLIDHFAGKMKTWGKFTEDGTADPSGGLKMKCVYRGTEEGFDSTLKEKIHTLSLSFTYVR